MIIFSRYHLIIFRPFWHVCIMASGVNPVRVVLPSSEETDKANTFCARCNCHLSKCPCKRPKRNTAPPHWHRRGSFTEQTPKKMHRQDTEPPAIAKPEHDGLSLDDCFFPADFEGLEGFLEPDQVDDVPNPASLEELLQGDTTLEDSPHINVIAAELALSSTTLPFLTKEETEEFFQSEGH